MRRLKQLYNRKLSIPIVFENKIKLRTYSATLDNHGVMMFGEFAIRPFYTIIRYAEYFDKLHKDRYGRCLDISAFELHGLAEDAA
jgi:hypothetical protein